MLKLRSMRCSAQAVRVEGPGDFEYHDCGAKTFQVVATGRYVGQPLCNNCALREGSFCCFPVCVLRVGRKAFAVRVPPLRFSSKFYRHVFDGVRV